MSLARGKFGIEYDPNHLEKPTSPVVKWVVTLVALATVISLAIRIIARIRARPEIPVTVETVVERAPSSKTAPIGSVPAVPAETMHRTMYQRPPSVRILLMRLEEAEKKRDIELAVSTIEQLRELPGSPAADLDDALARRLGVLNIRRLFDRKNLQWVKRVDVRRGDSASRLAAENGSTLASFARLNGGIVENLPIGSKRYVMNHPRFILVIHRRLRTADLALNGRFFKRYDLAQPTQAKEGQYSVSDTVRSLLRDLGVAFKPNDFGELELLLPKGASVVVSEM